MTTLTIGSTSREYFLSISDRERSWDMKFAKPQRREFFYSRSEHDIHPRDHIRLLDDFDKLVPHICTANDFPVLRHPDLHLWNIFVDPKDLKVTSILDWQGTRVLPYPIHAGYPHFLLNNGRGVSRVRQLDKLPDNFDSLDPDEKDERRVIFNDYRVNCTFWRPPNTIGNISVLCNKKSMQFVPNWFLEPDCRGMEI